MTNSLHLYVHISNHNLVCKSLLGVDNDYQHHTCTPHQTTTLMAIVNLSQIETREENLAKGIYITMYGHIIFILLLGTGSLLPIECTGMMGLYAINTHLSANY